jgi:hypothetical protein
MDKIDRQKPKRWLEMANAHWSFRGPQILIQVPDYLKSQSLCRGTYCARPKAYEVVYEVKIHSEDLL